MDKLPQTLSVKPWTAAKHAILSRYLAAWFPILETYHGKIAVLDGFCGPGLYEDGRPGSPLIALDIAANHRKLITSEIVFWFIDKDQSCIDQLEAEISRREYPKNFSIITRCARLHEVFDEFVQSASDRNAALVPTFAFIDPCGFSGIPFRIVAKLLGYGRCEVLVNLMVDFINRFLTHPNEEVRQHIVEAYGTEEVLTVAESDRRVQALVRFYETRLRSLGLAKFIRSFEMINQLNKPVYDLVFASNNELGYARMKDAMWKVDPTGQFRFAGVSDNETQTLFTPDVDYLPTLKGKLVSAFSGKGEVTGKDVEYFVLAETDYLSTHKKAALDSLRSEGKLTVSPFKLLGEKYLHGFPADCLLTFV